MESLPRDVIWQRIRGNVKSIYVKGVPCENTVSAPPSEQGSRSSSVVAVA